jgi:hypothetical protein
MPMTVREIREWLDDLSADDLVGVDGGGLCLRVVGSRDVWLEIGTDDPTEND